jgi:hypothetical protein
MKKTPTIGLRFPLLSLAGAMALLGTAFNANAVLLIDGPVTQPLAGSGTLVVQAGTLVGTLTDAFGPSVGGSPVYSGIMESRVVSRTAATIIDGVPYAAGGLDFYYRMELTTAAPPNVDIEEWNFSPLTPAFGPYSAQFLLGAAVPAGIPGFSGTANGTQAPVTVNLDSGTLRWDHTEVIGDTRLTPITPVETWLILHTNATQFGIVDASTQDSGVAPTLVLAPIPEPSAALFGVALSTFIGTLRRRSGVRTAS